jgi:ATP-dependent Clp protease, protease subunit
MSKHRIKNNAKIETTAMPMSNRRDVSALSSASAMERWNAGVKSLAVGDNVITMYEVIGEDYWSGGGVTAKSVAAQIRAIGDRDIEIHLNSPGGDMFEGIAIYNLLREHSKNVTVKIMGMAASAASIIAMAGNKIEMGAASFMMIHNCWVLAAGNRHDLQKTAEWLQPFDQAMVDLYAQQTGIVPEKIAAMLDEETWMSGSQAVATGFADALLEADQITEDNVKTKAEHANNSLRKAEMLLCNSMSRTDARKLLKEIEGKQDAANEGKPGAATTEWMASASNLLDTLNRKK